MQLALALCLAPGRLGAAACALPPALRREGETAGKSRPQVSATRGLGSGSTPCQDLRVYTQGSQNPPQGRTSPQGEDLKSRGIW